MPRKIDKKKVNICFNKQNDRKCMDITIICNTFALDNYQNATQREGFISNN